MSGVKRSAVIRCFDDREAVGNAFAYQTLTNENYFTIRKSGDKDKIWPTARRLITQLAAEAYQPLFGDFKNAYAQNGLDSKTAEKP